MEKQLQELLENAVLGDEARTALQEAFSVKLQEAESKLQESYAARFEHERSVLVETMDQMLNDVISKELNEFQQDKRSVAAQKVKLAKALAEAKSAGEKEAARKVKMLESFMLKQIAGELSEFRTDRKQLAEQRNAMAQELNESRAQAQADVQARVNKLEEFVLRQLSEELTEFTADKKALVEQRVKLAKEAQTKLHETREAFVSRATTVVDKTLNEVIRKELVQWRDDIKTARENNFGRKIFEAVAAEYMGSYLSEGSEVKKLQKQLQESARQLTEAQAQIQQKQTLLESEKRAVQVASDRAKRVEVMNELLNPLRGDKRAVMENLLSDIRTASLKEAFTRYLPTVMNGNAPRRAAAPAQPRTVAHSGDRVSLVETQQTPSTNEESSDLQNILYLAGVAARSQ
jgi:DNA-binding protein YbaB